MASFGDSLRRERELRQITLREISEATKINHRYLEALERNDFRHLPGGVFNKGFVRAYSQYIGIDPDRMVLAYLDEERRQAGPSPTEAEAAREPVKPKAFSTRRSDRRRSRRIAWGTGVALALSAVIVAIAFGWIPWPRVAEAPGPEPPAEAAIEAQPGPRFPDPPTPAAGTGLLFRLVRPTRGMLRCDDGRERELGTLEVGAEVVLDCPGGVVVDVDDAGALVVEGGNLSPGTLGPDGTPVRGFRLVANAAEDVR